MISIKTWKIVGLSRNNLDLIEEIYAKGSVTKKTQKSYISRFGFYPAVWFLRDCGVVTPNANRGRETSWSLTKKGKKLFELVREIEDLL